MFSPEIYSSRRSALAQKVGSGLILLPGNGYSPVNYASNVYPFRQDSDFRYFFGIEQPGLFGLIDIDSGEETIFGNEVSIEDIVWTGPVPSLQDLAAKVGVSSIVSPDKLAETLQKEQAKGRIIHFLPPYRGENKILFQDWLKINPADSKISASKTLIDAVVSLRSYKSAEELAQLDLACLLTNKMHLAAMKAAKPGISEAEVVAAVHREVVAADSRFSFNPICSVRGEILHNEHYANTLQSGQLLLVDAGGESPFHYAGDMTRTFPVDPVFTQKQKEVYEVCLQSQADAITALQPGTSYRDVHLLSATTIARGLSDLGLMKGDPAEAVAAGAHALFFPHGLGHMMGLDVHDMEGLGEDNVGYNDEFTRSDQFGLAYLRLARKLEPGFVLTVEPGIYFIPTLIELWKKENKHEAFINYEALEAYYDFGGIRIEDDYVITDSGARLLGGELPKSVADLENLRG